ncbi:MAG: 8-amino-3,8-dideoxy-manno-octulosonate cytidylyltransferase [Chlamydiae bacterium]|nr:8-amino-3,8-dideoxy-manno-octulosonate cytidylyltransferase [Chlamydiota bacterium]
MNFFKHLIVIPARYQSSRFPGKMLAKIQGQTLLERTYRNIRKTSLTSDILIATEDARIEDHARSFGAQVVRTSKNCPNGTHRTSEAIAQHPKVNEDTIVINVQGDEPLINPNSLERLAQAIEDNSKISMATLAAPFTSLSEAKEPSNVKCVFDQNFNALYFSRSLIPFTQDPSIIYHHLGIYAFRASFLKTYTSLPKSPLQEVEDLEQLKALEHGFQIKILLEKKSSFGIDLPSDIQKLEELLCR